MTETLKTPVLFLVFNRPKTTQRVFDAIRLAKPEKLYIVADGPRPEHIADIAKCYSVRDIVSAVDWDCEVHTNFRQTNFGCGRGLTDGISWFFEHETEGIILEDDCLPDSSFFRFCSELLREYRHDARVMSIGGNNFEKQATRENEYSYTFSKYMYIWGWATWKRAWKLNDYHMKHFQEIQAKRYLSNHYSSIYDRDLFEYVFDKMYAGDVRINKSNTWDYQWHFACKINSGLTIVPNKNLIVNIGFGTEATNTAHVRESNYDLKLETMDFPLRHPGFVMVNVTRERRTFKLMHTSWKSRLRSDVKQMLPSVIVEKLLKPFLHLFSSRREQIYLKEKNIKAYV